MTTDYEDAVAVARGAGPGGLVSLSQIAAFTPRR